MTVNVGGQIKRGAEAWQQKKKKKNLTSDYSCEVILEKLLRIRQMIGNFFGCL